MTRSVLTGFLTAGALAAFAGQAIAQASAGGFPDAPDRALAEKTCTACHVGAQVTSQRKTKEEWASTVEQMIGYGAVVSDADYPKIVNYLATHFPPAK